MLRIKELRENKGIMQKDLAKDLNIGLSTLSQYETGKREPDYETLKKIADYFNVSMDYMLGSSDSPNSQSVARPQSETERKLLLLARKTQDIPEEDCEALLRNFENTIEIYLKAKGINTDK